MLHWQPGERDPDYLGRLRVKSGMTGWAQIHGLRGGESSMAERVRCDLYYIEHWSVGLRSAHPLPDRVLAPPAAECLLAGRKGAGGDR